MHINASTLYSFLVVFTAGLIQAGFQLGIGLLLVSANPSNHRKKTNKTLRTTTGVFIGYSVVTWLVIIDLVLIMSNFYSPQRKPSSLVWLLVCGLNFGVALAVWLFYFKKGKGTALWIPRNFADHLTSQAKLSQSFSTSFILGMISFFSESLFLSAPLLTGSLLISTLSNKWYLVGILLYGIVTNIPLTLVWLLLNGGQHLSYLQKWREDNKHFIQFAIGLGLIVLSLFIFINYILFDKIIFG